MNRHDTRPEVVSWISCGLHHKEIQYMTLTLLKSRYQFIDNVLHCSVMAKKNKKLISYIIITNIMDI